MNTDILEKASEVASILKLISHEGRLKTLCFLIDGKKSVSELQEYTSLSQSQISQYLKAFELNNIVISSTKGKWHYYKICSAEMVKLLKSLQKIYCSN